MELIPAQFESKLRRAPELHGQVAASVRVFTPWLNAAMPFFPHFTDHSTEHLRRVLALAEALVRRDEDRGGNSWEVLTPQDAACLVLAVLVHDSAMHLTEASLLEMIRGRSSDSLIEPLDTAGWPALWSDFLLEARRWDGEVQGRIFADATRAPGARRGLIADVPDDPDHWDGIDRLLAGEFVRRHHPRMAHEFAVHGVPGPSSRRLRLADGLKDNDLADLAGWVARSHGMSIREAMRYADGPRAHYRTEHCGVHAAYLMALLRVADYLDLYAERAPGSLQLTKRGSSRYSREHWDAHQAVQDIKFDRDEDPEVVELTARPADIRAYELLRSWVAGIQQELDQSWACLGERYGRNPDLARLGLSARRIVSNLDDPAVYGRTPGLGFVPVPARLSVSGPDMMRLLVKPLYGENPSIGIRELLQNAVDAVRELRAWCERKDKMGPGGGNTLETLDRQRLADDADVVVAVCSRGPAGSPHHEGVPDDWMSWVEVSDRGIGMTPRVINEYFLRAGASYRRDAEYSRLFTDAQGRSTVARTGRFGIGVFAAFLLGDRIKVRTRPVEGQAVEFETGFDRELVNLRRVTGPCGIGTTVWVRLERSAAEGLYLGTWGQWFVQDEPPRVRFERRPGPVPVKGVEVPAPGDGRPARAPWLEVSGCPYERVVCRPGAGNLQNMVLGINGVGLGNYPGGSGVSWGFTSPVSTVQLHLADGDGVAPLLTTRSGFAAESIGVERAVHRSVCRAVIAAILRMEQDWIGVPISPAYRRERGATVEFIHLVESAMLAERIEGLFIHSARGFCVAWTPLVAATGLTRLVRSSLGVGERLRLKRFIDAGVGLQRAVEPVEAMGINSQTIRWPIEKPGRLWSGGDRHHGFIRMDRVKKDAGGFVFGAMPPASGIALELAEKLPRGGPEDFEFVLEEPVHAKAGPAGDEFCRVWLDELRLPALLPYGMAERAAACAFAIENLKPEFEWLDEYRSWERRQRPVAAGSGG